MKIIVINLTISEAENLVNYITAVAYHAQHDEFDTDDSDITATEKYRMLFLEKVKEARINNVEHHNIYLQDIEEQIVDYINTYRKRYKHPKMDYITVLLRSLITKYGVDLVKQKDYLHPRLPELIELSTV